MENLKIEEKRATAREIALRLIYKQKNFGVMRGKSDVKLLFL